MTLGELVSFGSDRLRAQGIPTSRLDVELLLSYQLNRSREWVFAHPEQKIADQDLNQFLEKLNRRIDGEPLAYIVGFKEFYKSSFAVSPAVLVPRPETELLVEQAVSWLEQDNQAHWRIVDLGTGSGCIGLSVVSEIANSSLIAIDKSLAALEIARQNAEQLGVLSRALFLHKDVKDVEPIEIGEKVDIVLGNPPYVSYGDSELATNVVKYEPAIALFAQEEGLACCHLWIDFGAQFLRSNGLFLMEIGASQRDKVISYLLQKEVFLEVGSLKDYAGQDRVVRAVRR